MPIVPPFQPPTGGPPRPIHGSKTPPPPPGDVTNGGFPTVLHDSPSQQVVLATNLTTADDNLTASITTGTTAFHVVNIITANLTLEQLQASELPPSLRGEAGDWVWSESTAIIGDGVAPVAAKAGQRVYLNVAFDVPDGTRPGAVSGMAVLIGSVTLRTVNLSGNYIGVDRSSPIGEKWATLGGEAFVGAAKNNEHPAPDGIGTIQEFDNGVLYEYTTSSRLEFRQPHVFYFSAAVWAKWLSLASVSDANGKPVQAALGVPVGDTFATLEGGHAMRFSGGAIVVRATWLAYVVYGAIYGRYAAMGDIADPARQPFLGLPIGDELAGPISGGRVSHFDGGDIYWSAPTGAHEIHDAIRDHWRANEFLGYPTTDESGTADGLGRHNEFQNGVIYWSRATGVWEVHGAILARWNSLGREHGYLGYPVSDEGPYVLADLGVGRISNFQHGRIHWREADGNITELPDERVFTQQITTPDGTALGGYATMTLMCTGDYQVQFHMHDSGAASYQFQITAVVKTQSGLAIASTYSGSVEGSDAFGINHSIRTDDDPPKLTGNAPQLREHFDDFKNGEYFVTKDYSATGLIGAAENAAKSILDVGAGAAGLTLGVVIGVGGEFGQVFSKLGVGGVIGVVSGVAVLAFTGGWMLALVTGVAAGALTEAMISSRHITQPEYDFCNVVFLGSLPPPANIILTNLSGMGGRAFTMPGVDGNIYINLGDAFGDPLNYLANKAYPNKGQLLVHELTHAWQIHHGSFTPGVVCSGIVNQANNQVGETVYQYGPPGLAWGEFNLEAQGAIVDQWFAGQPVVGAPFRKPQDPGDPYFGYIANNVRKGVA